MFRAASPHSGIIFEERRRRVRYTPKLSSTIVVELGANNGGTIINLGVGGLAVQSVAKLNPDAKFILRFRLLGAERAVETVGRVVWLGPTEKEAGIRFQNLPVTTERQIADWIEEQERPKLDTQTGAEPDFNSTSAGGAPVLSMNATAWSPEPPFEVETVPISGEVALPVDTSLPNSSRTIATENVIEPSRPARGVREIFASQSRTRRRNFLIASVASLLVMLALYSLVPSFRKFLSLSGSGGQAGAPGAPPEAEWVTRVRAFFGLGPAKQLEPAKESVPVWTVKRSGFYYCAHSPDFKKLQPGKIMTQGEALQSGYQPKVGGYCH